MISISRARDILYWAGSRETYLQIVEPPRPGGLIAGHIGPVVYRMDERPTSPCSQPLAHANELWRVNTAPDVIVSDRPVQALMTVIVDDK